MQEPAENKIKFGLDYYEHDFWFYRKVELINPFEYCVFDLNYGYDYHLKWIVADWIGVTTETRLQEIVRTEAPTLKFEITKGEGVTQFNREPLPFNLLTSPAGSSALNLDLCTNLSATSGQAKFKKRVNHVFTFSDTMTIMIRGQDTVNLLPKYCHVLLIGRKWPHFERA